MTEIFNRYGLNEECVILAVLVQFYPEPNVFLLVIGGYIC